MKHKFVLTILLCGCVFASFNIIQPYRPDTSNMVIVYQSIFKMGLDSNQRLADMKRFNEPASYFSQEYPARRVSVSAYYIDKTEITNAEYKKFVDANPEWSKDHIPDSLQDGNYLKDWNGNKYPKSKGKYPVVYVSWFAAKAYAKWVGKRLPMESEWECAAKANSDHAEFPWGDADADSTKANFKRLHTTGPLKTGNYRANGYGLYDMAGNVKEFCLDMWYQDIYQLMSEFNVKSPHKPIFTGGGKSVVIRGGGWQSPAVELRNTYRESFPQNRCAPDVGFRCALSIRR